MSDKKHFACYQDLILAKVRLSCCFS